jgi:hypothetical protein
MSTIQSCPACANPLRVPDNLLGQQVRCPTCSEIFTPSAPAARPEDREAKREDQQGEPPATEPEKESEWKELPLQLSLDEPSPPPPKPETPGLVGAVEVQLSLEDEKPTPAAPVPPESPPSRPNPPRLAEEDDDLRPCPACGKNIHYDARHCYRCGADLREERPRSRRRSRELIRRDAEPHRGGTILALGIISLCATATFCGAPVGVGLGLTAWLMGRTDLNKIRAGLMDRDGEGPTQSGLICGIIGTCLNGLMSLCCLGYLGFMVSLFNVPSSPTRPVMPPRTINPAPPPAWPPPGEPWKDKKMN